METLSGCKRFIVCIFSQSKPRGLKLFKIFFFFFFFFFFFSFQFHSIIITIQVTVLQMKHFIILPYTGVPLSRLRFRNILPQ